MCRLPSSPFDSSTSEVDPSAEVQDSDMLTALIPKNPTFQTQRRSTGHLSLAIQEARCIANVALPMMLTGLLLFSRSLISMLFLGRLGELALAGGSLAIGFANITGYSILSGLSMGMEPICGQAFGAKRYKILGITLQRTILLLFLTSIPIAFLWFNMKRILLFCGQEDDIATEAQFYILYSLPDLIAQSIFASFANISQNPVHHSAANSLCNSFYSSSHTYKLPSRLCTQSWNQRGCVKRSMDQLQSCGIIDHLHYDLWLVQENLGRGFIGMLKRLEIFIEFGNSKLYFGLPRMVVV
ncbi:hypothetical protein OIU84_022282 [Salix udensis]|uniref:Protein DETOXIFICATION n=1 Tax=Salix udensis TaxID=889485 RepID=A0AAD6PFK1_9ROSI|nr:hypothetical protein OIU84_022282 [Salix udensis]